MAIHSSILAWRIPLTEEPNGPQSMGSQRVRHDQDLSRHHILKRRVFRREQFLAWFFDLGFCGNSGLPKMSLS